MSPNCLVYFHVCQDSEDDEREETEEEFLERCAQAAAALENGTDVEEGDLEDQEDDIALGKTHYLLPFPENMT